MVYPWPHSTTYPHVLPAKLCCSLSHGDLLACCSHWWEQSATSSVAAVFLSIRLEANAPAPEVPPFVLSLACPHPCIHLRLRESGVYTQESVCVPFPINQFTLPGPTTANCGTGQELRTQPWFPTSVVEPGYLSHHLISPRCALAGSWSHEWVPGSKTRFSDKDCSHPDHHAKHSVLLVSFW